jgi:hypothetical protein
VSRKVSLVVAQIAQIAIVIYMSADRGYLCRAFKQLDSRQPPEALVEDIEVNWYLPSFKGDGPSIPRA